MVADIARWLESHGLARYAEAFQRSDIGVDVLKDLSDSDLQDLGMSLGDRKRLVRALADGDGANPAASEAAEVDAWARRPGERKPVTMLFADVTGSTALTENLDAEDAHDLLYTAVERLCAAVERNRGTVCRFMGDGVMAMFGAPVAFEDHAEWACRAALDMLAAVDAYARELASGGDARLQVRIGLNAGEVVVLRVGDAERGGYDASGPTVPLAARMEQTAEPGTVQVTASTFAMVSHRFDGEPLAPVTAKGFPQPVAAVRLLAERGDDVSAETRPFVGRRSELAQLRGALASALEERSGRLLYLRGEPGIGKSAVVEALSSSARELGFSVHRTLVLDFGTAKGRDPVRLLVRSLLGVAPDAGEEIRQAAAAKAVADGLLAQEHEPHLCDLLDAPVPEVARAGYEGLDTRARNRERNQVFGLLLAALAGAAPRLVVIEDLHWAPLAIRAYLGALTARLPGCAAVLAVTSRIEGDPLAAGWQAELDGQSMTVISLGPLTPAEARELAALRGVESTELVDACIERSGCNPLFLEHLLASAHDGAGGELPTSIQTSVAARVDSLDPADKRAVQTAAVLGQCFSPPALRALLEDRDYDCNRLASRGLVKPEGEDYLFAHALVQEAVLASLLRADRRALHARAADWYRDRDPVLYASHLDRAGDARAPAAYLEAARVEMGASRFVFARSFVERALELDAEPVLHAALFNLHGDLLAGIGEMRAASESYTRAAGAAVDPGARCAAWTGSAYALRNSGAYDEGLAALEHAQREAEANGLTRELAGIHHQRGNILFLQVDGDGCERQQQRALEFAQECADPELEALALSGLVRAAFLRGHLRAGSEFARRCVELARRHGFDAILYGHLHMVGIGVHYKLNLHEAAELAMEASDNAVRVGVPRQGTISSYMASEILGEMDRRADARRYANRSLELARRVGEPRYVPAARSLLAKVAARDGRAGEARRELVAVRDAMNAADVPFSGPLVFGALVQTADEPALWQSALADGRALLHQPCFREFLVHFYRDAIHASLRRQQWATALELAAELEEATVGDPVPLVDLYVSWARCAGPDGDRDILAGLREQASAGGLAVVLPEMDAQLA